MESWASECVYNNEVLCSNYFFYLALIIFCTFNCQSYASILYLRIPPGFRIILRGKDVERHNIVNDMMFTQEVTYRPQPGADGVPKDTNVMLLRMKVYFQLWAFFTLPITL